MQTALHCFLSTTKPMNSTPGSLILVEAWKIASHPNYRKKSGKHCGLTVVKDFSTPKPRFLTAHAQRKRQKRTVVELCELVEIFLPGVSRACAVRMTALGSRVIKVDKKRIFFRSLFLIGYFSHRFPKTKGVAGYVATTGETLNITDAYHDERFNR